MGQTLKVSKVFRVRGKPPGLLWSPSKLSRAHSNLHLNLDGFVNQASFLAPAPQKGVPEKFPGLETDETTHIGSKKHTAELFLPWNERTQSDFTAEIAEDLKGELMEQVADGKSTHMTFFIKISLKG